MGFDISDEQSSHPPWGHLQSVLNMSQPRNSSNYDTRNIHGNQLNTEICNDLLTEDEKTVKGFERFMIGS